MCSDLAKNLCSVKRVGSLVQSVDKVGTLAKVNSWIRTVVASLRKMKRDYGCFPDVVTPFAAGLSQVGEWVPAYHLGKGAPWTPICRLMEGRRGERRRGRGGMGRGGGMEGV